MTTTKTTTTTTSLQPTSGYLAETRTTPSTPPARDYDAERDRLRDAEIKISDQLCEALSGWGPESRTARAAYFALARVVRLWPVNDADLPAAAEDAEQYVQQLGRITVEAYNRFAESDEDESLVLNDQPGDLPVSEVLDQPYWNDAEHGFISPRRFVTAW